MILVKLLMNAKRKMDVIMFIKQTYKANHDFMIHKMSTPVPIVLKQKAREYNNSTNYKKL